MRSYTQLLSPRVTIVGQLSDLVKCGFRSRRFTDTRYTDSTWEIPWQKLESCPSCGSAGSGLVLPSVLSGYLCFVFFLADFVFLLLCCLSRVSVILFTSCLILFCYHRYYCLHTSF